MNRRTCLVSGGVGASILLAGCVSEFSSGSGDDPGDDGAANEPEDAIDAYIEAAKAEDEDAVLEAVHSDSPLREFIAEADTEFDGDGESIERGETAVLVEDASADDLHDLEGAPFLLDDGEFERLVADEDATFLEVEIVPESAVDGEVWILVTEDEEWRVFWTDSKAETPEDPKDAFEEPILDEDADVVEEIDWEYDQGDEADELVPETDWAQVVLTDSPGIEADAVRVESTIEGWETEMSGAEPGGWAGTWVNVALDPEGDQIVITAIEDDTEEVVHRVHYEP